MDRASRNVHGQNITKVRPCDLCAKCVQTVTVQVYTKPVYCTVQNKHFEGSCELLSLNLILMVTSF